MSGSANAASSAAAWQVPPAGRLVVDHVAHFVADLDAAAAALAAMGFALTPLSVQRNAGPDGVPVPAGAANRCAMLARGYLEFLTPMVAPDAPATPIAAELRAAMARHAGVHLLAFGSADIARDRARLAAAGFAPLPPVALQRTVPTADGETAARFSVLRVKAGAMAEGRVQFVHHLTPAAIWQDRWTTQPNGAVGLAGVVIAADDPADAASRYARFTGLPADFGSVAAIATDRGIVLFVTPEQAVQRLGIAPPQTGRFAASVIACADVARFAAMAAASGCGVQHLRGAACIALPPALGGTMLAIGAEADPRSLAAR